MALTLMIAAAVGTSCTSDESSELERLPIEAIGAVTIGPSGLPIPRDAQTTVVAFDDGGNEVGRLSGGAITSATTIGWRRGLTTANSGSVITLTPNGNSRIPIDENMIEGATPNFQSGGSLFWFNTARPDGPTVPYRNNYVMTSADASTKQGSVPGMMLTAGHCNNSAFGVVADFDDVVSGNPNGRHRIYEMTMTDEPRVRGEWEQPTESRPFSRTSVCSSDGSALYNIYGSVDALRDDSGESDLTLVRIDTHTGALTHIPIDMDGHHGVSEARTLTLINDRLYWIATDGAVLSTSVTGTGSKVREEWRLPQAGRRQQATVNGTIVSSIDYNGSPTYTEFELLTGRQTRKPVELPWIEDAFNNNEGSTLLNVSSVPR